MFNHKARSCADGSRQKWGVNNWGTHSPVVNWLSVRLLLALAKMCDLHSHLIVFVLVFPQADLDCEMRMELPLGMHSEHNANYVLKLKSNSFGMRQGSYNWCKKFYQAFLDLGFTQ